ncbi:MAG: hypothetical protein ABEJ05_10690 [Haloglomus sp.]
MQDTYKELMFRSFKDAMDIVADYNEWAEDAFDQQVPVPPQAVPQIAMALYQSRVAERMGNADLDFPDFDGRMYE